MFASNTSQVSSDATYIEDVFSTYLYTGNGSTQTINNGIDLSTYGGLVWFKNRGASATNHLLVDSARGSNALSSNTTGAQVSGYSVTRLTNGFSFSDNDPSWNASSNTYASWAFRKQPKFFDVVTYTGNSTNRTIAHNLGSVPGCIIVKNLTFSSDWVIYHRSLGATQTLQFDTTAAVTRALFNNTSPTSTVFSLGDQFDVNQTGSTYVAYLFAHNAGGFGLTGADNVISCGSYTGNGSATGPTINLGFEPQWVMTKRASGGTSNWIIFDNMRGLSMTDAARLLPNGGNVESSSTFIAPNSTGFSVTSTDQDININGSTYIYIAIRRGPMKTPTSGTSVFEPATYTGNGSSSRTFTSSTVPVVDSVISYDRSPGGSGNFWTIDRLRGTQVLKTFSTAATDATSSGATFDLQYGYQVNAASADIFSWNTTSQSKVQYLLRRAAGFFDEVCYTGNATANTAITHNLTVVPELIITKSRSATGAWWTLCTADSSRRLGRVNTTNGFTNTGISTYFGNDSVYVAPTSTAFTLGSGLTNASGTTYVAYLFATVPGVSKVGTYTGNGSSQTINCGFTGGARFVLIKAASATGDWLVADSARGIVAGNDPYIELNTTNAEFTGEDWLDTDSTGFVVNEVAGSNANTNGVSYIYLAIA